MSNTSTILKSQKGPSTLMRAKFGPGMLLQHEDLEQLNTYTRDLSRLLFRSFFGCGVVCGLQVTATESCGKLMVTVGAGIALDCIGDPIYVPKDQTFAATDDCDPNNPPPHLLWVVLCSTTKCCSPRTPACGCDDTGQPASCTREVDGFEVRIMTERPECACGCPEQPASNDPPADSPGAARAGAQTADGNAQAASADPCHCLDCDSPCYKDHYNGVCGCKSDDCNCVLLARLDHLTDQWNTDYHVRRFIRPVLMRDPLVPKQAPSETNTPQAAAPTAKVRQKQKH